MRLSTLLFALFIAISPAFGQTEWSKVKSELIQSGKFSTEEINELNDAQHMRGVVNRKTGHVYHYLQQEYQGIPVFNAIMNVIVDKEGKVVQTVDRFSHGISRSNPASTPGITAENALIAAATHLKVEASDIEIISPATGKTRSGSFNEAKIAIEPIPFSLVYEPTENGVIRLAWEFVIRMTDHQNWWQIRVDAITGEVISKNNWIATCSWDDSPAHNHGASCTPVAAGRNPLLTPASAPVPNGYNVYAAPLDSPYEGSRSNVTFPWNNNLAASPFGWHDTNGAPGAEFTITRGNNVWASEDRDADNIPGFSPDGGANLDFDFALDLLQNPVNYQEAAITNLFFWNNLIHDVMYNYGFDEQSGNFQANNYGNGGLGNDEVIADAQDGSGTNNANFGTPPDGEQPRMQMFEWTTPESPSFSANGVDYFAVVAGFGAQVGLFQADIVLANDGSANPSQACNALINPSQYAGKIVIMDRGTCSFTSKVLNAQNAGAIGVIMVQNVVDPPFSQGGASAAITIPSVMISLADGNTIKAAMLQGAVEGIINLPASTIRDSDLDNGVIAHEFGHGISNRLTAGADNVSCLFNIEQMGEGWSDYFGLYMTMKPSDNGADARGIGNYAIGYGINGPGIRPYPYSTDMSVNPMTYNSTAGVSVPHGVGSVWCTMLWDMTWLLIEEYGFDPDIYNGTGGNNIALQLVMDGLKLQPCSPGFVDGRDAILLADQINYGGANQCLIWEAFARRGLGFGADQGSTNDVTDGVESYETAGNCSLGIDKSSSAAMSAGGTMTVTINVTNNTGGTVTNAVITDVIPTEVTYVPGSSSCGGSLSGNTLTIDLGSLADGASTTCTYQVQAPANPFTIINLLDDMESGVGSFTTQTPLGTASWLQSTARSNSPTTSWFAENPGENTDLQLTLPGISGITNATFLSFSHFYNTEELWDGCVLEISTDGTTWNDAGALMTQNGYNGAVITNSEASLSGRAAWTGSSGGFVQTIVDLSSFAGQTISIRWWLSSDIFISGEGWYVDDVFIGDALVDFTNNACVSSDQTATYCDQQYTMIMEPTAGIEGCTDVNACNFNPAATVDDGSCLSLDACGICGGSSIAGCTDVNACNFNPAAGCDDGSCLSFDACGICGGSSIAGCTDVNACNFNPAAGCDDGSCLTLDACGICGGSSIAGCTDVNACNFNPAAGCDDGSCLSLDACGICGGSSIAGCTDVNACNFNPAAGCDDGSCLSLDACGICGGSSIAGCTDVNACNFNPAAGCDDGSCTYPTTYYTDADGDGFGSAPAVSLCAPQAGFVLNNTDCDDTLNTVYPGAMGTGEGLDNDCNGLVEGNEVAPCVGDFNQDGFINVGDLLVLLGQFGCTESCPTDMNNDGAVNAGDMLIFFGLFNTSCP